MAFFDLQTQSPIGDGISRTITEYTDSSQIKSVTDDNGHAKTTTYDTANRRNIETDAKNNTVTIAYDANSNVISMTEVERSDLGNPNETFVTNFAYDNLDRQTSRTDAVGNISQRAYDSRNNISLFSDELTRQTRYVYDGMKRLLQTIHDMDDDGADGNGPDITTTQTWDDDSRLTGQTDDNGNTTSYSYDSLGRRVSAQFADGTMNVNVPDVHDNIVSFTDANGSVSTRTYDLLNRLTSNTIAPGSGVASDTTAESFQYDGVSNINSAVNNASTVTRRFDSMRHVTRETLNGVVTQCVYDSDGNQTQCVYPGGRTVSSTYDSLDRHMVISDATGTIASYSYVGPGRIERRLYGNTSRTDFTYDGALPNPADDFGVRMPVRITHSSNSGATILDDRTFTWDRLSNKTRRKDERLGGPRLTHDYTYDDAGRLIQTHVTDATPSLVRDTGYGLDGVNNRTTVTGSPDPGSYACSAALLEPADCQMNQYTSTSFDGRGYDKNGNLVSYGDLVFKGGCQSGDMNNDNALAFDDVPLFVAAILDKVSFQCRADVNADGATNGRDIQPFIDRLLGAAVPTRQFALRYDYANRMVEHEDTVTQQRHVYFYDALGRRIKKIVDVDGVADGPIETRFFFNDWQEIEEQSATGATQATYVFGTYIDEVLNMRRGGQDYYYHADDLYNVMAVSNAAGAIVERYEYQDFGQLSFFNGTGGTISGSAIGNSLLFTGRRFDPETNLYYYRTRYLDSRAGRFTTRDTIGIWEDSVNSGNGNTYVGNSPGVNVDPYGDISISISLHAEYVKPGGTHPKCPGQKCPDWSEYGCICIWIEVDWSLSLQGPGGFGGGSTGGGGAGGQWLAATSAGTVKPGPFPNKNRTITAGLGKSNVVNSDSTHRALGITPPNVADRICDCADGATASCGCTQTCMECCSRRGRHNGGGVDKCT